MEIHRAPEALQAFVRQRNLTVEGLTAHQTVATMIDWYRTEHVVDADSDMLLVQWGVYDWGSGPSFEYDVTRQMTSSATDGEGMWQIHITLHYAPSAEAVAVEAYDRWCADRPAVPARPP